MYNRRRKLPYVLLIVALGALLYAYITVPGPEGWINSWKTMDSAQYVQDVIHDWKHGGPSEPLSWDGHVGDKIIVMGRMPGEDASWVENELPDWQRAIYEVPQNTIATATPLLVSSSPEALQLPANKGHEAMAYLTYLIDFYDRLPSIMLFLHAHRGGYHEAWHVDARLHSNVLATQQLRLDTVKARGYVNMRCNPRPNCLYLSRNFHPSRLTGETWTSFWANTSTPEAEVNSLLRQRSNVEEGDPDKSRKHLMDLGNDPYPAIGDPAGAQFAITREVARQRPRSDYIALREWLLDTDLSDEVSGRIFEYLWHIIFGMPAILCYERARCECDVYSRCD